MVRIAELFAIKREIKGAPLDQRRRVRQERALPRLASLRSWLGTMQQGVSSDRGLAKACRYPLIQWAAIIRYCDDSQLEVSNNLVENVLRAIALGRRNWTFIGSIEVGQASTLFYSLVKTCKLNGVEPAAWLIDLFERIGNHPINRIDELLPWRWQAARDTARIEHGLLTVLSHRKAIKAIFAKDRPSFSTAFCQLGWKPNHGKVRTWVMGFWSAVQLAPDYRSGIAVDERTATLFAQFTGFIDIGERRNRCTGPTHGFRVGSQLGLNKSAGIMESVRVS